MQLKYRMVTIEDLTPENHFLRKLEATLDLSFVYAVTDSTHIKTNASRASEREADVAAEAGNYWERLDAYEEEGLEELKWQTGQRRAKRTKQVKKDKRRSRKKVSSTDPESGYMKRPGKPSGFYYLSHQTTDPEHGIVTAVTVTPGDVHDSRPYLEQLE